MDLPPSVARSLDDVQLCFNKAHFNRRDFSVDRFVNLARRRATLDVIYNDLRAYLRFLQNSMIELINDDYADFVNLSSSLAVLKESIDKVSSGVESSWCSFSTSTSEIRTSAQLIQQKCLELVSNRTSQIVIRNRISLLLSIQRLSHSLENRPAALSSWLPKLSYLVAEVELWNSRVPEQKNSTKGAASRQTCYSRIKKILIEELIADVVGNNFNNIINILQLLSMIGKDDVAISKVASSCISQQMNFSEASGKVAMLKSLFDQLLTLRNKWIATLEKQSQMNDMSISFLDRALLHYASGFLDEKFGSVFVPSDPNLFHKCYDLTADFVTSFAKLSPKKNLQVMSALKSIIGKFNTVIYFKMITQQCQSDIKKQSTNIGELFIANENEISNKMDDSVEKNSCRCTMSLTILLSLRNFFGDCTVFLPVLADRLWDFTLKCLNSYLDWAKLTNDHFCNQKDDPKALQSLVILAGEVKNFELEFKKLYTDVILNRFRSLNVTEFTSFDTCVSLFSEKIVLLVTEITNSVVTLLSAKAVNELMAVSEIPRQYRWTKRPAPTCFSTYLQNTFGVCENFESEALQFGWTNEDVKKILFEVVRALLEVFCDKADQVLESVEQTGTSLQRFKRKMQQQQADATTASADTDEAKIRSQLAFDISFMRQRAAENGADMTRLSLLQDRVLQSDARN